MTISRPARPRWPPALAAGLAGVAVGLLLGLALGGGDDSTGPEEGVRETRSKLSQAAGLLDIVPVEYAQAVQEGKVVRPPEYRGVQAAVQRSRALFLEARPAVVLIDEQAAQTLDAGYQRLARSIADRAPASLVERQAEQLRARLGEPAGRVTTGS